MGRGFPSFWFFCVALGAAGFLGACSLFQQELWIEGALPGGARLDFRGKIHLKFPRLTLVGEFIGVTSPSEGAPDLWLSEDRGRFDEAKQRGELDCFGPKAFESFDPRFRDPEGCYVALGLTFLVVAYFRDQVRAENLPSRWSDLVEAVPTASQGLPREGLPIAVSLLSEVLAASRKDGNLRVVFPLDGAVPVPVYLALSRKARHRGTARELVQWLLTPVAQNALVRAGFHSIVPGMAYPDGARPLSQILGVPSPRRGN